jgi:hypothetical protein
VLFGANPDLGVRINKWQKRSFADANFLAQKVLPWHHPFLFLPGLGNRAVALGRMFVLAEVEDTHCL